MSHYQLDIREWWAQQNTVIRNRKNVFDRANNINQYKRNYEKI